MSNPFIMLNSKRYHTVNRSAIFLSTKAQQVEISLSGKTLIQTFDFLDQVLKVDVLTSISVEDLVYGTLSDLYTAYDLPYVSMTDSLNATYDVVLEGGLSIPIDIGLLDDYAPFKISLNLRKRQV